MAKIPYEFMISVDGGDSSVVYLITERELKLIDQVVDEGECFDECEALSDLYERVHEAALEQLQEDLDLGNEADIDPEDLDFCIDFGDVVGEDESI